MSKSPKYDFPIGYKHFFFEVISLPYRGVYTTKSGKSRPMVYIKLRCVCGTIKEVPHFGLYPCSKGHFKSCGCKWDELTSKGRFKKTTGRSQKDWVLQTKFGISLKEYQDMLNKQGNVCACCGKPETSKNAKMLAVDHDHKTGKVRGLLCSRCNNGIGALGDSVEGLQKALNYLLTVEQRRN